MEQWKDISGYEGQYQVSNLGRVKSVYRIDNKKHPVKEKILKQTIFNNGYCFVSLSKNGKPQKRTVHSLVAEAFLEKSSNKLCIDHINTIRTDNRVENLRYVTQSENLLNPISREKMSNSRHGKATHKKAVLQLTEENEVVKRWECVQEAALFYGSLNGTHISECCKGKRNKAYGYKWSYASDSESCQ